jgi:hypothetical protein
MKKSFMVCLILALLTLPLAALAGENRTATLNGNYTFSPGDLACSCTIYIRVTNPGTVITLPAAPLAFAPNLVFLGDGGSWDLVAPQGTLAVNFTTRAGWVGHEGKWLRSH